MKLNQTDKFGMFFYFILILFVTLFGLYDCNKKISNSYIICNSIDCDTVNSYKEIILNKDTIITYKKDGTDIYLIGNPKIEKYK